MTKAASKTESKAASKPKKSAEDVYKEMLAQLSPEEQEALGELTGENTGGGTKTPIVKINYQDPSIPDLNGNKVAKGNWVIGQVTGMKDGEEVVEEFGTDLGPVLECTILKMGKQYNFWSKDAKQRCSSQLFFDNDEVPIGHNLKYNCKSGKCPRRQDGLEKKDRCSNQHVIFVRLPEGTKLPDGEDCPFAMVYVKGTSYKPFDDFKKELRELPAGPLSTTVKVSGKATKGGSNIYYIMQFELGAPTDPAIFRENYDFVAELSKDIEERKEKQMAKLLSDGGQNSGSNAATPALAAPGSDAGATDVPPPSDEDDDIPW